MRQLSRRPSTAALFHLPAGLSARAAHILDVPRLLQLVNRSVAFGCRDHYTAPQRHAVYLTYASHLFVDVSSDMETWLLASERLPVAVAQVDPTRGRLRALFIAPDWQGQGVGRLMLAGMERVARKHGISELHGSMAMNAIGFYAHAGFATVGSPELTPMFGVGVRVQVMRKKLL